MSVPTIQHEDGEWIDVGLNAGGSGGALYASGQAASTFETEIGDPEQAEERMSFAGIDGVFAQRLGSRTREIRMFGVLRVTTAALGTIRAQRDSARAKDGLWMFTDWDGTVYANCVISRWSIGDRRHIEDAVLEWRLSYEIGLEQLAV